MGFLMHCYEDQSRVVRITNTNDTNLEKGLYLRFPSCKSFQSLFLRNADSGRTVNGAVLSRWVRNHGDYVDQFVMGDLVSHDVLLVAYLSEIGLVEC